MKNFLKAFGRGLLKGATDKTTIAGVVAIAAGAVVSPELGAAVGQVGQAIGSGDPLAIASSAIGAALILFQRAQAR